MLLILMLQLEVMVVMMIMMMVQVMITSIGMNISIAYRYRNGSSNRCIYTVTGSTHRSRLSAAAAVGVCHSGCCVGMMDMVMVILGTDPSCGTGCWLHE